MRGRAAPPSSSRLINSGKLSPLRRMLRSSKTAGCVIAASERPRCWKIRAFFISVTWIQEPLDGRLPLLMRTLQQALSIARKDLAIELRTKESLNAAGAFAITILLLLSFVFDVTSEETVDIAG